MPDTAMDARVLGQLLLMQSVMINLPDEEGILAFVCRGLKDIPGVGSVTHDPDSREATWRSSSRLPGGEPFLRYFPLRVGQSGHGELALTVSDGELLEPYVAYLNNFCFMLAVVLDERRQRRLIESHKAWLEDRAEERTAELKTQTARREVAEAALAESEDRFRQLMELAPEAIVVIEGSSDRPVMANRKAEELFGCSRRELLEKGYHRFYRKDQPDGRPVAESIREHRALALAGEEAVFERSIRNARGEDLHCEVRLVRLTAPEQSLLRASWVDITGRKKTEAALAQQNIFLNTLLEVMPTPFYFKNTRGEYLGCNRAFEELLGYPREEIVGRTVFGVAKPEMASVYQEMDDKLFREPGVQVYEAEVAGKHGVRRVILSKATYLGADGEVAGLMGVITDITEYKKTQDALRQSEERYRAMADASISGFMVYNGEGLLVEANEAYAKMSGYSREELGGMPISRIDAAESPDEILEHIRLIRERGADRFETRHRTKDGRVVIVEVSAADVPRRNQAIAFVLDITARKQAEALLNARLELTRKSETLSLDEVLQHTLDEAERLTGATIGFFHLVDEDQRHLTLQAWSAGALSWCTAKGKGRHYPIEQAGIWADCLRLGHPVTHNDFQNESGRKGYPAGHVHVANELVVPIYQGGQAVAIMGVGNKRGDFSARDVEVVEQLANLCWNVVSRKRAEEKVLRSLQEKTVLLKEVHHRVKNNLQILMSLIDLQADTLVGEDTLQAFRLMQNRVRSIALAHERLYRSPDLGAVQMRQYLSDLVDQVAASHLAASGIRALVNVEDFTLGVDRAIPLGLLVTELVTNAFKHAFKGKEKGELQVGMACWDSNCLLTVADDGPGLPASLDQIGGTSLGMQLVRALSGQLGGELRVSEGPGARFDLKFPLKPGEGAIADGDGNAAAPAP